jgi:hypothetical protein
VKARPLPAGIECGRRPARRAFSCLLEACIDLDLHNAIGRIQCGSQEKNAQKTIKIPFMQLCCGIRLLATKTFLVTAPGLTRTPLLPDLRKALGPFLAGEFTGSRAHVPKQVVLQAARQARQVKADALVSFGGSRYAPGESSRRSH